ncbi:putative myosin-binding protein 4 [Sesamum alatum]|uniref:Myosin-binding protein 4 n=1 Tax=Sesamum alatum TaxID=300844 RepID=A0AAE1XVI3_9LAMI|nr:putative myosin-binding protein 4 [Sesamum alatum]
MAVESSSVRRRKPHGFMTLLSSAACEWFLMFLMFVNAAFSHFLTRFAQYCELETPCLLCSRLDTGFGRRKPGSYWSLLCSSHREEISSVVSCSVHGKFADVHGMCEECLTPMATKNRRNSESYRLLVGKSWVDVDRSVLQSLMLNKNIVVPLDTRMCSCCSKPWRAKSNAERLLEPGLVGFGASKANVKPPLPRAPGRSRFSRRDTLKRLRDKNSGPMGNSVDTLCHVGYTKLKISSDSESEVPISEDDDDGNTVSRGVNHGEMLNVVQCDRKVLDQPNLLDPSKQKNVDSSSSNAFTQHGLRDLDLGTSCNKPSPSLTLKLISLDKGPQVSDVVGGCVGESGETSKSDVSLNHLPLPALSVPPEPLPLSSFPSLVAAEKGDASVVKDIEAAAGTSSHDARLSESSNLDCNDAPTQDDDETQELLDKHELEPVNKFDSAKIEENVKVVPRISASEVGLLSKETSPRAHDKDDLPVSGSDKHEIEPVNKFDSAKTVESLEIEENVKIVSQISAYEVGLLSKETSPRAHDKDDKSRIDEDSGSEVLPFSGSPKNNGSEYEALVGITVSYIEGESIVDILKRQIEHDRNIMNSLYKELEEERNAAAIAANQAMAMITRLQEEKATLHMEALHYLRMMDEQAEYDMEALERANELLAEREKELQDMEIELDFYRSNLLDEQEVYNVQKETSVVDNQVTATDSTTPKTAKAYGVSRLTSGSASNFEDERFYFLQGLKKLETNLHQAHLSGKLDETPHVLNPETIKVEIANLEELPPNGETLTVVHKVIPMSNGNYSQDGEINSGTVEKDVAELHDKLETLQKQRNLHKHASELLLNGKNGTQVVQELAHQIHELRKIELQRS